MKRITGNKTKVKKSKNIKIIILFIIVLLITIVILIRKLPTIRSIDVKIEENSEAKITEEEILDYSRLKVGDKLYKYLRSEIEKNIEDNPYVKNVEIQRNISGKITIKVSPRKAEYMINYSGEYIFIDDEGYVLEVSNQSNQMPILIGVKTDFSNLSVGDNKIRLEKEDLEKLEIVNNILSVLKNNDIQNVINSIDITDKNNIILNLDEDGKSIYLGNGNDLNTKALYIKKILEKESGHTGAIYINGKLDEGYVYFKEQ